jgi:hypothetical protein
VRIVLDLGDGERDAKPPLPSDPLTVVSVQDGPVARKLRPGLIRNIATPASFPFYVWPWPFMPKMIEMRAMIRSMVAKKCRFRRIGEICTDMKSTMARQEGLY